MPRLMAYNQASASKRDIDEVATRCVGRCCGRSLSSDDAVSPAFSTDLPEAMKFRASGIAGESQHGEHMV